MKEVINEMLAIEVMGWTVQDASAGSYLDDRNEIVADWNPYENYQHAFWTLARLHHLGFKWNIVPNKHGRPVVQINDKDDKYLSHGNTHKPIHSICFAVLGAFGLSKEIEKRIQA